MKKSRLIKLTLFFLLALVCASGAPPERPHLVLISIDGLVPDYYVRPDRLGLRIPNLRRLCRDGASAEGVVGIYPTVTYPSHTTIVTGAKPADHGIIANTVFDDPTKPPTKRWYWEASYIKSDTLWAAAKRAGLSVASLFWPVTVGADQIDWNLPEIWDPWASEANFISELPKYATPGLVDEILKHQNKTLANYRHSDESAVEAAAYLIERHKPNLTLLHLIDLDHTHHDYGPYSAKAFEKTEQADANVGRILEAIRRAGIEASTTVAVVSDHGFMRVDKQFNPGVLLVQAGLIRLDERGHVVSWKAAIHPNGGSAAVYLKNPEDKLTLTRVKRLFERYTKGPNAPLRQVVSRDELNRLGTNPAAVMLLEAADHYAITGKLKGPRVELAGEESRGKHGYLPERPEMYASLILWGQGIRPRTQLELVRMTDIAPTLARVLHIKFQPPSYSRPMVDMLAVTYNDAASQRQEK
jgi:predicted AlkP superfamily pyrophosphatase or phosphodiesterase